MSSSDDGTKGANSISPAQVRAARGLLNWTIEKLIEKSGISKRTLIRFENSDADPRSGTMKALRAALENAGVIFLDENGGGAGVRLRKEGELPNSAE